MGLYLCIFDDNDEEVAGFQVGHYSDFDCFRSTIARAVRNATEKYPLLMQHDPTDGEWTVEELPRLKLELSAIAAQFRQLPPKRLENAFEHNRHLWEVAGSLYECFHSVDEENLFEALLDLCDKGLACGRSILFQ